MVKLEAQYSTIGTLFGEQRLPSHLASPACDAAELSWFFALTLRPHLRDPNSFIHRRPVIASFDGLDEFLVDAVQKNTEGEHTFLCTTGPLAGVIAADLSNKSHRTYLQRFYSVTDSMMNDLLAGGVEGLALRAMILHPSCLTQDIVTCAINTRFEGLMQKKVAEKERGNQLWFAEIVTDILTMRSVPLDRERFIANMVSYTALARQAGYSAVR